MARIDKHGRTSQHQKTKLGRTVIAVLDFKQDVYQFNGDFVARTSLLTTAETPTVGSGMMIAAESPFSAALIAKLANGFTFIQDLNVASPIPNLNNVYLNARSSDYAWDLAAGPGPSSASSYVYGVNPGSAAYETVYSSTVFPRLNRLAATLDFRRPMASMNGSPVGAMAVSYRAPPKAHEVIIVCSALCLVERITFMQPVLDPETLQRLSRV